MDNAAAPVKIDYPVIPPGYCFSGSDRDKFNQLITQFLANGVINIPGFGQVTPQEIAQLNARVQELQNEIDALDPQVRTATVPLNTGDNNYVITFSEAMPSTNYTISIEINDTGAGTAAPSWAVVSGTKSTTGVTLRFFDIAAAQTSFTYIVQGF